VSIVSNIAEGFERGTSVEFVQYLYVAKGSSGEVRAQLQIACDQQYITESQHVELRDRARQLIAMISNFMASLQRSNYAGEKTARPRRQAVEAHQRRLETVRESQLANIERMPRSTSQEDAP